MIPEIAPEWLVETATEIHTTACEKGWWGEKADPTTVKVAQRNYGELMMLSVSELSEALEDYRKGLDVKALTTAADGKPEGFPSEIADTVIRLLDNLVAMGQTKALLQRDEAMMFDAFSPETNVPERLLCITSLIVSSYSMFPNNLMAASSGGIIESEEDTDSAATIVASAIYEILNLAQDMNIDLQQAISLKNAFNKTRPYRHGGKLA